MVPTHAKNMSQIGSFPQVGLNIKKCLKPPPGRKYNLPIWPNPTLCFDHCWVVHFLQGPGYFLLGSRSKNTPTFTSYVVFLPMPTTHTTTQNNSSVIEETCSYIPYSKDSLFPKPPTVGVNSL